MNPVAVPTPRNELTEEEDWRLRRRPKWARAAWLVAALIVVGGLARDAIADQLISLAWHPTRPYRWLVCGGPVNARAFAIYTRHPKWCAHAPFAPFDCAATCEGSAGAPAWDTCEPRCPAERLERMWTSK